MAQRIWPISVQNKITLYWWKIMAIGGNITVHGETLEVTGDCFIVPFCY